MPSAPLSVGVSVSRLQAAVVGGAVQYIPPARPLELASYLPLASPPVSNLATDGAATHGIKWFSSIDQVSAKVSGV